MSQTAITFNAQRIQNRPVTLRGSLIERENKARMWALDADGELAIDAELELEQA